MHLISFALHPLSFILQLTLFVWLVHARHSLSPSSSSLLFASVSLNHIIWNGIHITVAGALRQRENDKPARCRPCICKAVDENRCVEIDRRPETVSWAESDHRGHRSGASRPCLGNGPSAESMRRMVGKRLTWSTRLEVARIPRESHSNEARTRSRINSRHAST